MANTIKFYTLPTLPSEVFPDMVEGSFIYAQDVSTLYLCVVGKTGKVYEPIPKITNAQLQDIYRQLNELRALINASGKIYRSITYNLPSHIISDGITTVEDGSKLVINLTPMEHYSIASVTVSMGGDILENVYSDGVITIESVTNDITITATEIIDSYNVSYNGSGVKFTGANRVNYGTSLIATITPNVGVSIKSVDVTMGGMIIQNAYVDGKVTIPVVNGDIAINVETNIKQQSITYNLTNLTKSGVDTIEYGSPFQATLTIPNGYTLTSVNVTMGGKPIDAVIGNMISINSVTDDVVIDAVATANVYAVTNNLTNLSSNGLPTASHGSSYNAVLTAEEYHSLPSSIEVAINGVQTSNFSYNSANGAISIPNVTGPITITASGVINVYRVDNTLTNITSNGSFKADGGTVYTATLTPEQHYNLPSSIVVVMGGSEISNYTYSQTSGDISIPNVNGDIVITAIGVADVYTVTSPTNANMVQTNVPSTATYGEPYTAVYTPEKNYALDACDVTMGGTQVTDCYEIDGNGVITVTIDDPIDNITINVTAKKKNKVIGDVVTSGDGLTQTNTIEINDGALDAGDYIMRYADADGEPLDGEDNITTFTIS